ncbi:MAG: tetratricopeptide repeat protein, partial [Desulfuromonadales bacterium]|nr:tetratricopeptide repeat protein [Desulfuromonadales bacterium]
MSASFDPSLLRKIVSCTETLVRDPQSAVFVQLSDAYRQLGMLEDALAVANKGVTALPQYAPGLLVLGRVQFEMGQLQPARATLEAAHLLDRGDLGVLRGLARVLVACGEKERAWEILEEGARLHPGDGEIRKLLATLPPRALPAGAGATTSEGEPIATPTIAEIYLKQGFPQRALKVYQDLLKANPENQGLRQKLVDLQQLLRQLETPRPVVAAPPPV